MFRLEKKFFCRGTPPPSKGKIFWHQIWLDTCSDWKKNFFFEGPPPLPRNSKKLLWPRGGQYASCVHAGGLSCLFRTFRLKLSPLLPAAIEILTYKEQMKTKSAKNYLQRVVLSILRTQPDGLPISLLVHNNPEVLARNDLHRIAKQWLPESMHEVQSVYICRD